MSGLKRKKTYSYTRTQWNITNNIWWKEKIEKEEMCGFSYDLKDDSSAQKAD